MAVWCEQSCRHRSRVTPHPGRPDGGRARHRTTKSGIITQGISPQILLHLPHLVRMVCASEECSLISRYTREEMGRIWSEEGKFRRWLEVEVAATETLAERGVVPAAAAATIGEKARIDADIVGRIAKLEAR